MPVALDRIPIARPYIGEDAVDALRACVESGWVTMGPGVARFESAIAAVVGGVPAVACSSCTSGMHLALLGWGVGPGDEVIVPAYTFVASAHAVACTGATPVFCDVDAKTGQIDPASAASAVTARTRAIMPVHFLGIPAPMREINALARKHDLKVIEDAACALGSTYEGAACGALGDAGSFSFHPRKVITTGEGGALVSADDALLDQARAQRNHGSRMSGFDRHQLRQGEYAAFDLLGFNYRMTDLQANLGLTQLGRLDEIVALRQSCAREYSDALGDLEGVRALEVPAGSTSCWQSFPLHVGPDAPVSATDLRTRLDEHGVQAVPSGQLVPELGFYRARSSYLRGAFPVAEDLADNCVSIPLFAGITEDERARVVEAVRSCWS